ncbi:uncharacterized protein LOC110461327 isoform X2 [Mizuhopecten yessoensis]|uniref:uncharacterized protein LOC110461327 isoform X2 n=1 Tax=Mizuhopecten yessoensis TaxID=6573 RepID=UPI000B457993|nr:uncharacterized protein LOC110461327 isoform X2 [Mizuhopecten yessoensis]
MKMGMNFVFFVVTCLYTGTSGHRYKTLSEFMFRRQTERTICNSYGLFKRMLQRETNPLIDNFVNSLFEQSPITGEMLRSKSAEVCSDIATEVTAWVQENRPISSCLNTETVSDIMDVYSGLCTGEGAVTAFFTDLGKFTGLEEGPGIHQRQMQESFQCVYAGIDDNDTSMCGDTQSLKKIYLIIELLYNLAPGANFTVTDFGL